MRLLLHIGLLIFPLLGFGNNNFVYKTPKGNNIIAHRGAWKKNNLPENSLAALREAIRLKCAGSEFDVRMTIDDSLVVVHDTTYNGLVVEKVTYNQLLAFKLSNGEKLPTLFEYIKAGQTNNPQTLLVCEIKPSILGKDRSMLAAQRAVELVQNLKAENIVHYISFSLDVLNTVAMLQPNAVTQFLSSSTNLVEFEKNTLKGINLHYTAYKAKSALIDYAKSNHLILNAWTVNNAEDMDWLIANEFDYITTNEPELLMQRIALSPVHAGWKLVFSDEFNAAGLPDSTKWNYDVGGHGWGNNEKQFYLKQSPQNSYVKNGNLFIVAQQQKVEHCNYTSAKLTTYETFEFQYGKVEVMAKLPKGKGTWPAIWMLPTSLKHNKESWPLCGEIDIMEHVGANPNVVHTSLHSLLYNHMKGTQITYFDTLDNVFDSFHKYGIEWTENSITFFIDDKVFLHSIRGEQQKVSTNEGWPFDKKYFLILNLAMGGNWGGEIDDQILPAAFEIDFVRIYQKN